jgi:hypothetical protein
LPVRLKSSVVWELDWNCAKSKALMLIVEHYNLMYCFQLLGGWKFRYKHVLQDFMCTGYFHYERYVKCDFDKYLNIICHNICSQIILCQHKL